MFWLNFSIFIVISVGSGVQDIGDLPGGGAEEGKYSAKTFNKVLPDFVAILAALNIQLLSFIL